MTSTRLATTTLAVALAIALAGVLGACSHDDSAPLSGLDLTADVDLTTGQITEPMDRFRDSAEDDAVTADAMQVSMTLCAAKQGVTWVPAFSDTTYDRSSWPVEGPWVEKDAAKFGFLEPGTDGDVLRATHPGVDESHRFPGEKPPPNSGLGDAAHAVVEKCGAAPDAMRFDLLRVRPQGPWDLALGAAQQKAFPTSDDGTESTTTETKPVEDDYDACLRSAGAEPDPTQLGWAQGADRSTLDAQQITLALTVVRCKTQVHYAQRLADIGAKVEAPIVRKYGRELAARKVKIDAVVASAKAYLAAHPDVRATG
jgi:hypothetical protein